MELENIVANTVYLKAREGGGKRKGKSKKWKTLLQFPHVSQCVDLKGKYPANYDYVVDKQPVGRELFRKYCVNFAETKREISFLDKLNEFELTPAEKRDEAARQIIDNFFKPDGNHFLQHLLHEDVDDQNGGDGGGIGSRRQKGNETTRRG